MDRLTELSSFVAVIEAGSFVGAADALGLSKAAVSRHVTALEQGLGVRLLHRTTRKLSPTDDGRRLYSRAKDWLDTLSEMESELTARSSRATGILRVNAPLTFGVMHLAPLWGVFAARHPRLSLDISLNDRLVDLVEEGYDLAIRITNLADSQLVSRKLATTRMIVCASLDYLKKHGTPVHPADLAGHRIISYSYWSTRDEWTFVGPDGVVSVRTQPFMHSNNGDTCRGAALGGHGVIMQPDFMIHDDVRSGALVPLLPGYQTREIGIYAVYASRKHLPMKTRALVDFLVEMFEAPSWQRS